MTTIKAKIRFVKISPRIVRGVIGLIRGKDVSKAETILSAVNRKSARILAKLLKSAIANAENNHSFKKENLYVSRVYADEGPALKRYRAATMGRATMVKKRTAHVVLELEAKSPKKVEAPAEVKKVKTRKRIVKGGKS